MYTLVIILSCKWSYSTNNKETAIQERDRENNNIKNQKMGTQNKGLVMTGR